MGDAGGRRENGRGLLRAMQATVLLAHVRFVQDVEGSYRLRYELRREQAPSGGAFYAVACYVEVWREGRLWDEDFEVAGLGRDEEPAMDLVKTLAHASAPVLPCHLGDMVRDFRLGAPEALALGCSRAA